MALFVLSLENTIEPKRKLRKRLENGTRRTRVQMSNSWCENRAREENAGTLEKGPSFVSS